MDISFTRGDTQFLQFQVKDANGDLIELTDEDVIYFTVKQNSNSKKIIIQKKYPDDISYSDGYFYFVIDSQDTSNLAYGQYQYDIELKSGEYVRTLGMGTIELTEEITFRSDEI